MRPDSHELYGRRRSRNLGVGLTLAAFVLLTFAVTIVKLGEGEDMRGFDHTPQTINQPAPAMAPQPEAGH